MLKKSCCIRIGPQNDFGCANIITSTGLTLPWVREIRYFGSYLTAGRQLRCSVSYAKRSFYRATNAIFGKIGRFVSEEVLIELVINACLFCYMVSNVSFCQNPMLTL